MNTPQQLQRKKAKSERVQSYNPKGQESKQIKKEIHLVIQNKQTTQTDDQNIEEVENSLHHITIPRIQYRLLAIEDYVQLPKIIFNDKVEMSENNKLFQKTSGIKLQEQNLVALPVSQKQMLFFEQNQNLSESGHGIEWANWNIDNLKIMKENSQFEQTQHEQEIIFPVQKQTYRKRHQNLKAKQKQQARERERRERERNIEMVNNFLSGKATFIWLFIVGVGVKQKELEQIRKVYSDYTENDYQIPVCRSYEEALRFLNLQSCFFKIVADYQNSQKLLDQSAVFYNNIIAIFLYNPKKQKGITKAFELKRASRKIKGMFMNLDDAVKQAEQQIYNQAKFIKVGNDLQRQRNKLRFPSFFILTDVDSSQITAYRLCLYGSLKLENKKQRQVYLKQFTDMVERRYSSSQKELRHLEQYKLINHLDQNTEEKFKQILQFYVKQNFYYGLTNSILRLSRSAEQFRPCTIPFNETYLAIKHFYSKHRAQKENQFNRMVTYRGAKLRKSDVNSLKNGTYIQLLGFTSTSLKRSQAEKFMDNDSYLIEIQVQVGAQKDQEFLYDHGFVEINKYGLANEAFQNQEEVLFNALNVFEVIALDLQSAIRKITLRYGVILDLLRVKNHNLNHHQKAFLSSYRFCMTTFKQIQDDGDVLLMAQQHDKCLEYYQTKIEEQGQKKGRIYGKLANVQVEVGDLDGAYDNALKSLQLIKHELRKTSHQSKKYLKSVIKTSKIFDLKEDIINYQQSIDICLQLNDDDWLSKLNLLKIRASKKMKFGDFKGSRLDIQKIKEIIANKKDSFGKKKGEITSKYLLKAICSFCFKDSRRLIEQERQLELLRIQEQQIDFQNKKEELNAINLQIQTLSNDLAIKNGNKTLLQSSKQLAQKYFNSISQSRMSSDPILSAKYHVLKANVAVESERFGQYQEQMQMAIQLVRDQDPFHQDIGLYSKMLANKRHNLIHKNLSLPSSNNLHNQQGQLQRTDIKFNYNDHKRLYQQSKLSYIEAANNMIYHKGSQHPQVIEVQNQMAELDFDYSLLRHSQAIATQVSNRKTTYVHSEGAKCFLLLAKIFLAKGQLKTAFKHIEQAQIILKKALVKIDNAEYNKILINSPIYMDIIMHKVKIFNRQLKHDLALKQLDVVKRIGKIQIQNQHHKNVLANIYEEQAQILVCIGETQDFQEYIQKAIDIREQQMGKFNIPNAISYANLFKYMRYLNDFEEAMKYHYKATEIFSRFPPDHPNAWIIHLSNGLTFHKKRQYEQAIAQIQYCLKVAQKRYSSNHINLLKIQFQYGKLLHSMGMPDKALKVLQDLQRILIQNIRESSSMDRMERETDDQKLSIRKNLYLEMRELYSQTKSDKNLMKTMLGIERCDSQLRQFQELFYSQERIDSLKSLN